MCMNTLHLLSKILLIINVPPGDRLSLFEYYIYYLFEYITYTYSSLFEYIRILYILPIRIIYYLHVFEFPFRIYSNIIYITYSNILPTRIRISLFEYIILWLQPYRYNILYSTCSRLQYMYCTTVQYSNTVIKYLNNVIQ